MHPLPPLATMADPCAGVPANPWCPVGDAGQPAGAGAIGPGGYSQVSPTGDGGGGTRGAGPW